MIKRALSFIGCTEDLSILGTKFLICYQCSKKQLF
jgi:hypothetical protein